jgi:hypothetical protein
MVFQRSELSFLAQAVVALTMRIAPSLSATHP